MNANPIRSALFAALLAALPAPAGAAELEAVRLGVHQSFTRIVADFDSPPASAVAHMDGHTAVLRLEGVSGAEGVALPRARGGLIGGPMSAQREGDALLLRVPLKAAAQAKTYRFSPDSYGGHRVVLDLHGPGGGGHGGHAMAKEALKGKDAARRDAALALSRGDAAKACAILSKNFPAGSWDLEAMLMEGQCLAQQGLIKDARGLYEQMLAFDPTLERVKIEMKALPSEAEILSQKMLETQAKAQQRGAPAPGHLPVDNARVNDHAPTPHPADDHAPEHH